MKQVAGNMNASSAFANFLRKRVAGNMNVSSAFANFLRLVSRTIFEKRVTGNMDASDAFVNFLRSLRHNFQDRIRSKLSKSSFFEFRPRRGVKDMDPTIVLRRPFHDSFEI